MHNDINVQILNEIQNLIENVLEIQIDEGLKIAKRARNIDFGGLTIKKGVCPELDELRLKYEQLD